MKIWSIGIALLLLSCSSNPWIYRHGATASTPLVLGETVMPSLAERWTLFAPAWFASSAGIVNSQVYDSASVWIGNTFEESLTKQLPQIRTTNSPLDSTQFLPINFMISEGRFQKMSLPRQGYEMTLDGSQAPWILWIHEISAGPNLSRQNLYDVHHSIQDASSDPRIVKTFGLLVSWTLWDNQKQRIISTGISEVHADFSGQKNSDFKLWMQNNSQQLANQLKQDLFGE